MELQNPQTSIFFLYRSLTEILRCSGDLIRRQASMALSRMFPKIILQSAMSIFIFFITMISVSV